LKILIFFQNSHFGGQFEHFWGHFCEFSGEFFFSRFSDVFEKLHFLENFHFAGQFELFGTILGHFGEFRVNF
jgi:hypothetical protein